MRPLHAVFGALLLLLACTPSAARDGEHALTVACAAATRQRVEDTRALSGVVDTPPDRRALVSAETAGRVRSVAVREGDAVKAGQVLVEIDAGTAGDASNVSKAHVTQAALAVKNAKETRDRTERLFARGIAARHELDDASSKLGELEAALSAAEATASEAGRVVGRTRVVAPFAGVVTRVLRHSGELVDGTPSTALLEVADTRSLEIALSVAARDLLALRIGLLAHVSVDGLDTPIDASVVRVAPALDPLSGIGSARLGLPARDPPLPLGLAARVSVVLSEHEGIVVPASSIRGRKDGASEVLLCEGGKARAQEVLVGAHLGPLTEVVTGVKGGAQVVVTALGIDEGTATEPAK
jgi:RND family efflux transporter MFP subunit